MKFMLEIKTGNASFHHHEEDEQPRTVDGSTVAEMLNTLAERLDGSPLYKGQHGVLRDTENGLEVGTWKVTKR